MTTPTNLPATFVAGNVLTAAEMNDLRGAFRILQVASTTKNDSFSTTSTSFVDVTGFSVSITPRSTSSLVFVLITLNVSSNNTRMLMDMNMMRGSTNINQGAVIAGKQSFSLEIVSADDRPTAIAVLQFLDTPNTTSATTYKAQVRTNTSTLWVNRDFGDNFRSASTITVMEVSA